MVDSQKKIVFTSAHHLLSSPKVRRSNSLRRIRITLSLPPRRFKGLIKKKSFNILLYKKVNFPLTEGIRKSRCASLEKGLGNSKSLVPEKILKKLNLKSKAFAFSTSLKNALSKKNLAYYNAPQRKSAIYMLINIERGMAYPGSALNLTKRLALHLHTIAAIRKDFSNIRFQRSRAKYGDKAFVLVVAEWVPRLPSEVADKGHRAHLDRLLAREQVYLDLINEKDKYNFNKIAGSRAGSKHSLESKLKISLARKGVIMSEETKAAMSLARKGVTKSVETRAKMSVAQKGVTKSTETRAKISTARKGVTKSEETRSKMSEIQLNRSPEIRAKVNSASVAANGYPLKLTNKERMLTFEAPSIKQAVDKLALYGIKTSHSTLNRVINGFDSKLMKGWEIERLLRSFPLNSEDPS